MKVLCCNVLLPICDTVSSGRHRVDENKLLFAAICGAMGVNSAQAFGMDVHFYCLISLTVLPSKQKLKNEKSNMRGAWHQSPMCLYSGFVRAHY